MYQPDDIISFWFSAPMNQHWFSSNETIDAKIRNDYEDTWMAASRGELDGWQSSAEGCLALAIVLDQFPLNMYREDGRRYSTEQKAVKVTLYAVEQGLDQELSDEQKAFLYMPLMHSEDMKHQDLSVQLFEAAGLEENLKFARHHRDIVQRFDRFPHRNEHLGRNSTPEEIEWLSSDDTQMADVSN